MKKGLKLLVFTLLLTFTLAVCSGTAWGATFDNCAEALEDMGLFQGSDTGYELDRVLTRGEAAAMLVRMLGAEDEALAENYEHPFTDLVGWESPYVGYMYAKGLTGGATADTYNPRGECSLQMYAAFILRALGYGDDFAYADAVNFAAKLGVVDFINAGISGFRRDNAVAISYTALATHPKDSEVNLLTQLVEAGAVDAAAAAPYQQLFDDYAAFNRLLATAQYERMEATIDLTATTDTGDGESYTMDMDSKLQLIAESDDLLAMQMALTNTMVMQGTIGGETLDYNYPINIYLKDGVAYLYADLGEEGVLKYKADLNVLMGMAEGYISGDTLAGIDLTLATAVPDNIGAPQNGIAMAGQLSKETKNGITSYTMDMSQLEGLINGMLDQMMGAVSAQLEMPAEEISYDFQEMKSVYRFNQAGDFKGCDIYVQFSMTQGELTMSMVETVTVNIVKTGSQVTVTLPDDLDEYVDVLSLMQAAPEGLPAAEPEPEPGQ